MGLLGEVSRLAAQDGAVVLRETITPSEVSYIKDYTVKHAGLEILKKVSPETMEWEQLELLFGTHKEWSRSATPYPEAYYLFLAKCAQGESGGSVDAEAGQTPSS
jgi:hypothetical protein